MQLDLVGLLQCDGFDWDASNAEKNWRKHGVSPEEAEQVFFNRPLLVTDDEAHSEKERRYYALGVTDAGRMLFAVFTVRGRKVRVISVRDMSRKERIVFHEHEEESAEIQE